MPAPVIRIDLSPPYRVAGQSARHQSVWLLARIWLAATRDQDDLRSAEVRARFADAIATTMAAVTLVGGATDADRLDALLQAHAIAPPGPVRELVAQVPI